MIKKSKKKRRKERFHMEIIKMQDKPLAKERQGKIKKRRLENGGGGKGKAMKNMKVIGKRNTGRMGGKKE